MATIPYESQDPTGPQRGSRKLKVMFWTGWVISAIPILFMGVLGLVMMILNPPMVAEGMAKYGYPPGAMRPIQISALVATALYAFPRTSVLGAILLTGYLGGAVATHVRAGEPFIMAVAMGVLVWLGLVLRDARVRDVLPIRRRDV